MSDKDDLIKAAIRRLIQITNKYSRIETLPIQVDDDIEISTKEIHTIQAVGEKKQTNVTELAAHFGVTKSAASQLIGKLAKKGLIEKGFAPHSNKELELSLTDLGWKAFRAHERFHGDDLAELIERLSVYPLNQVAILLVLLEAIDEIMDERLKAI